MNMVIPNAGKNLCLYWALCTDGSDLEDFIVRLYQNDYTPDNDSTPASFDEATFTGYSAVNVDRAEFSDPTIVANVAQTTSSSAPTYTCTGGAAQTVYGWYMQGVDSENVIAAQRFDTPRVMSTGATETLDPFRFKLKTFA